MTRLAALKQKMAAEGLDSFLITEMNNIYYLTGFFGTAGTVWLTADRNYFVTDDRYIDIARGIITEDFELIDSRDIFGVLADLTKKEGVKNLGFEDSVNFGFYKKLAELLLGLELRPLSDFMMTLRWIKDESEIEIIKKACQITDEAFDAVLHFIEPGKTEVEIANFLDFRMRELGASGLSFDTIVASGVRSSLPHGVASHKMVEFGDIITMDFGCYYEHYVSDMTRTVFVGEADPKLAEIYSVVLKANEALIAQTKPGLSFVDFDRIPRQIIEDAGYGPNFTHSIGHGIGLDIHELPFFPKTGAEGKLEVGMAVTDEPGIYVSGFGGVRIEDDLLLTASGCEVLSQAPKELIVI